MKTPTTFYYHDTSQIKQLVLLTLIVIGLPACRLFENDNKDSCVPDFGVERISDFPRFNPEEEGIPAWIDKNHLCIRFYDSVGKAKADSILGEFGFIVRFRQNFNDPLKTCNFVRMVEEPADVFYTTYGDTTIPRFGNRAEVEYAHPAIFLEDTDGFPGILTTSVSVHFTKNSSFDARKLFTNSVLTNNVLETNIDYIDRLEQNRQIDFFVTKRSSLDPIQLTENLRTDSVVRLSYFGRAVFDNGLPRLDCSDD